MKPAFCLRLVSLWCAFVLPALAAQQAIVQKKANLRKNPSAAKPPIAILLPGEEVQVLDAKSAPRYVKVRTDNKKTGWALKAALEILPPTSDTSPVPSTTPTSTTVTPPVASGGVASAISPSWPKQKPVTVAYEGAEGTCPPAGQGGDTPTNLLKNRSDALPEVHDVLWSAIAKLAYPAGPAQRSKWTKEQLAQIQPYEGIAIRTVGYLAHKAKVEDGGTGESCNCKFLEADDVDWHMYLANSPTVSSLANAVIVETTPRIRKERKWDFSVLERYVGKGPVRISGFLMLDPEHRSQVGTARETVWEIHPVMKIEVCDTPSCTEGQWKDLDGLR